MKICLAQIQSQKGDIPSNIEHHQRFVAEVVDDGIDVIVFPELSITGYEPTLVQKLAMTAEDPRLEVFQQMSDRHRMAIAMGVPLKTTQGVCISLVIFHPQQPRQIYAKQYLHEDEEPYFVAGQNATGLLQHSDNVALSICYELSVFEHAETAVRDGAKIYLASVAKSAAGIEQASPRLAKIAREYALMTLMVNCVGACEDFVGAGQSAVWNAQGQLIGRLNSTDEGLLMVDTATAAVVEKGWRSPVL